MDRSSWSRVNSLHGHGFRFLDHLLFIPANKQQAKPKKKDIFMMMLGGLLGIGGNLLLYINGLNITGPVDAFVIRTVQPIIVIALAVLILHADFNRYKAIGIVLGLAGTLFTFQSPRTPE